MLSLIANSYLSTFVLQDLAFKAKLGVVDLARLMDQDLQHMIDSARMRGTWLQNTVYPSHS